MFLGFGVLVFLLVFGAYRGVIFADAWQWFIVPTFGVDPITWTDGWLIAIALSLMFLEYDLSKPKEAYKKEPSVPIMFFYLFMQYPVLHGLLWFISH